MFEYLQLSQHCFSLTSIIFNQIHSISTSSNEACGCDNEYLLMVSHPVRDFICSCSTDMNVSTSLQNNMKLDLVSIFVFPIFLIYATKELRCFHQRGITLNILVSCKSMPWLKCFAGLYTTKYCVYFFIKL